MTDNPTALITEALQRIQSQRPPNGVAVVLIGSAARDSATADSDLDLLVLASPKIDVPRTPDRLHIQSLDEQTFVERLKSGDDFAAWCVRFGVPITSSQFWLRITSSSEASIWPDWRQKIPHASRRLVLAHSLVQSGDIAAAAEESLYAVTHTGRAVLLKNSVFPLSRPEMIPQLRDVGYKPLANLTKSLLFDEPTLANVKRAIRYTKRLLVHLDRDSYRTFVADRNQRRQERIKARSTNTL